MSPEMPSQEEIKSPKEQFNELADKILEIERKLFIDNKNKEPESFYLTQYRIITDRHGQKTIEFNPEHITSQKEIKNSRIKSPEVYELFTDLFKPVPYKTFEGENESIEYCSTDYPGIMLGRRKLFTKKRHNTSEIVDEFLIIGGSHHTPEGMERAEHLKTPEEYPDLEMK